MKNRCSGISWSQTCWIGLVLVIWVAGTAVAQNGGGIASPQPGTGAPPAGVVPSVNNQPNATNAPPSTPPNPSAKVPASVPDSFRGIRLGMTLDAVESALETDPYFDYRGPPDVSMLASPDENLIETSGYSYISRAFFQFYQKKLYIMILMLDPGEISYYTMYTTLVDKYGPSTSLSPEEVVWESPKYRLSLERPLSIKYIDRGVFDSLKKASKMKQTERSTSREQFLNQF